jgi:lipopolysaccharide biosynthesis glycosyltransferase
MINIYIGYDPREAVAYHVCCNSLIRHSSVPLSITPLALTNLCGYAERHRDGSNQFIYSRFLVPELMGYKGWAIFMDGDMLLRTDIAELWEMRDESKAVLCVHHDYKTKAHDKYLGAKNQDYPRKNWSSVVLWNCGHPANQAVTSEFVEKSTGAQLHRFTWLDDDLIGQLPVEWNWLPDEFGANPQAKLLHWTLGTPCFHEYSDVPMAGEWHRERMLMDFCLQRSLGEGNHA